MQARESSASPVTVVGAGLAGSEAAVQLARAGLEVRLLEMKPAAFSPAHALPGPAELVCSNSLKSDGLDNAHGLLKREMRRLGSVVLASADSTRIPAGAALAVDREAFSGEVGRLLERQPGITYCPSEPVERIPAGDVVLATGPLTSGGLVEELRKLTGAQDLHFYDALAPILSADSIDESKVFRASRWGKGGGEDYLNCPLSEEEYRAFVRALRTAPRTPLREFEDTRYFEGCLPVEVLAERGEQTLAFGPMRPVGLQVGGRRPYAVVQLRAENREGTAYNLVGFQTKLTQASQREVFRMIPGLERASFLRYGAVHRNMYVDAPRVLRPDFGLINLPRVRLAGQIVGVEGYVESAAIGMLAGILLAGDRGGEPVDPPPPHTALGALCAHVRGDGAPGGARRFEPMNIHFGLFPDPGVRGRQKRREAIRVRADEALTAWMERHGLPRETRA